MHDSDYFVKDITTRVHKSGLMKLLDDGLISTVERDYGPDSKFRIER